ncbi:MAG: dTDP-4-dehydrorhamnose reductase [Phycisphaeraceae bacterium]|nr:dTDP-4-dehydrorhamnose reductase [Phycisphaeraceae bacterium]
MSALTEKPIVLLGADGMLGRAFAGLLQAKGRPFEALTLPQIDFTRPDSIRAAFSPRMSAVINCAAYTDVDGAESNSDLAEQINGRAVGELARLCKAHATPLIHFSTDYVFDGNNTLPYSTDAPRHPVNKYGQSKAHGEELIEQSGCEHLIIRTSWLYAPWGKNFVRTIAAAARTKPELRVVNDQRGRPTSAQLLARSALSLLDRGRRATWHITDSGECTRFDFASAIVRLTGAHCNVIACTSAEFPRQAKRPAYSVLDIAKAEQELGPFPAWQSNLSEVIACLEP